MNKLIHHVKRTPKRGNFLPRILSPDQVELNHCQRSLTIATLSSAALYNRPQSSLSSLTRCALRKACAVRSQRLKCKQ